MKTVTKNELLGTVVTDSKTDHVPDLELLKEKESETAVISAFCTECGTYHELAFPEAEKIFTELQQPLDFENKYLLFGSCSNCKGPNTSIELKAF
ncbi:MAG TPA: hypothetical protein VG982_01960 [Candidatus Paceibacterota bacterium]|jgi:hypothetical protein|nr:hypothetical protein [Candidatus Paceibacterota bacterium]